MNPNNPKRLQILDIVQEADARDQPIQRYKQLADVLGLDVATVKTYVLDWEFRGRLVRSSRGELHVLSAANDGEASGVHNIKPLTPEEIATAREASKRPKRVQRPVGWLRQIILGESDKMLEGAAPDNPELARQIAESKTLAVQLREQREPREARERPRRRVVPQDAITRIIESDPLPMPKAMPAPARRLLDEHRAQSVALDLVAEQNMMRKMREQAAREEREIAATGKGSKACRTCLDMAWRRPKEALCRCGKPFEPEMVEISLERQSSIALCERQ